MEKKKMFIEEIKNLVAAAVVCEGMSFEGLSAEAEEYFKVLQTQKSPKPKQKFTENGKGILTFLREYKEDYANAFKAKDIADGMGITSRTVSGAIRKLVTDGYVEKISEESPIVYALTTAGETVAFDE